MFHLFVDLISVGWRFLIIYVSNYNRYATRSIYANAYLFWFDWIHSGRCSCTVRIMRKGHFQNVSRMILMQRPPTNLNRPFNKYRTFFHLSFSGQDYGNLPNEAVIVNTMGLLMVAFAAGVVYLSTTKHFRRLPLPEDAILLTGHDE